MLKYSIFLAAALTVEHCNNDKVETSAPHTTLHFEVSGRGTHGPIAVTDCAAGDTATKDYDGDGLRNCVDPDIDGDGVLNDADCDPYHSLVSLSLCGDDDLSQKDYDGDGVKNCDDSDIDGDGVPNESDGNPYRSLSVKKSL